MFDCVRPIACAEYSGCNSFAIPKIQQLRHPLRRDQNISRLQVPMHHQVLMRVMHRAQQRVERAPSLWRTLSPALSAYRSSGWPSTYSVTRYGTPSSVVPPSTA